jgi:hypothetical protein
MPRLPPQVVVAPSRDRLAGDGVRLRDLATGIPLGAAMLVRSDLRDSVTAALELDELLAKVRAITGCTWAQAMGEACRIAEEDATGRSVNQAAAELVVRARRGEWPRRSWLDELNRRLGENPDAVTVRLHTGPPPPAPADGVAFWCDEDGVFPLTFEAERPPLEER